MWLNCHLIFNQLKTQLITEVKRKSFHTGLHCMSQTPGQQTTGLKNINIFVVRCMEQPSTESWNKVNDNRNSQIPIVLQSSSLSASPWQEWELRTMDLNRTSVSSTSLSVLTPPPLLQTTGSIPWKKTELFLFCSRWTYHVFGIISTV